MYVVPVLHDLGYGRGSPVKALSRSENSGVKAVVYDTSRGPIRGLHGTFRTTTSDSAGDMPTRAIRGVAPGEANTPIACCPSI